MGRRRDRRLTNLAWALVFATTALPLLAAFEPGASAAVLCQRKKKVKLRPTQCKRKEAVLQDLGQAGTDLQQLGTDQQQLRTDQQQLRTDQQQLRTDQQQLRTDLQELGTDVGEQEGQLGMEKARVDELFGQFRLECLDASLTKVESDTSFYFDNIECGGACRTHDGNQATCEAAWAVSESGATSCFFFKNLCLPCAGCGEEQFACTNTCQTQVVVTCPNDPSRTVYAGGPSTEACQRFTNQADCELAFHASRGLQPASCFWNGSECRGCGPRNENEQDCTNTCRTVQCADPTRTVLRRCEDIGNDANACAQTWHLTGQEGEPASCFFDAATNRCRGCGFPNELRGRCDNVCR